MKKIFYICALCLVALTVTLTSCNDYTGKYEMTDGLPVVYYVRPTDAALADSLLTGAFMGSSICLVGDNLTSIQEIYFNDQKATLNINFITKNTLIVNVPQTLPVDKTDQIKMITSQKDTIPYDFVTQIPNPVLSRIYCENVPPGGTVTLLGDYFLDYPDAHISVKIGNYTVPYSDITHVEKTTLSFIAPPADVKGYITVETDFGTNNRHYRSLFRDGDSEIVQPITGFEPTENGGSGFVGGWGRPSAQQLQNDPAIALSGTYVRMEANVTAGAWSSAWQINIWGSKNLDNPNTGLPDPLFPFKPAEAALKIDINVMTPWTALPLIFCFTTATDNEGYMWGDATHPRAFYAPWVDNAGSYVSNGWETVTIPLADFKYLGDGTVVDISEAYSSLGIALHNRGAAIYSGTADCTPVILLDNVRVVKM
ncbi:MAG: glycan-binding surface protein [Mediterranea sp.]|jgi:hypothetical protein|nr:glycan-binding surface protein [Mediterranea sp.]